MFSTYTSLSIRRLVCCVAALNAVFLGQAQAAPASLSLPLTWDVSADTNISSYALFLSEVQSGVTNRIVVGRTNQALLSGLTRGRSYTVSAIAISSQGLESPLSKPLTYAAPMLSASLVNAAVFYNHSAWDSFDSAATAQDDLALAPDKVPLRAGQIATFKNYTSYSRGLNGVMVDIAGLPGTVTATDFAFKSGNDQTPSAWANAPRPQSVTIRPGAGVQGSDRVTLIWPDNALQQQWLEVTVLPTANTGLDSASVFYFGNAIGDTGDEPATNGRVKVNGSDAVLVRMHPHNLLNNPASLSDVHDFDKDQRVNSDDELIVRLHPASFVDGLVLLDLSGTNSTASASLQSLAAGTAGHRSTTSAGLQSLAPSVTQTRSLASTDQTSPVSSTRSSEATVTETTPVQQFAISKSSDGTMQLATVGNPNMDYVLESAEELASTQWTAVSIQPILEGANWIWTLPTELTTGNRVFRLSESAVLAAQ